MQKNIKIESNRSRFTWRTATIYECAYDCEQLQYAITAKNSPDNLYLLSSRLSSQLHWKQI